MVGWASWGAMGGSGVWARGRHCLCSGSGVPLTPARHRHRGRKNMKIFWGIVESNFSGIYLTVICSVAIYIYANRAVIRSWT